MPRAQAPTLPEDDQCDPLGLLGAWLLSTEHCPRTRLALFQTRKYGLLLRHADLVCYKHRPQYHTVVLEFHTGARIQFHRHLLAEIGILASAQQTVVSQNNAGLIRELDAFLPR